YVRVLGDVVLQRQHHTEVLVVFRRRTMATLAARHRKQVVGARRSEERPWRDVVEREIVALGAAICADRRRRRDGLLLRSTPRGSSPPGSFRHEYVPAIVPDVELTLSKSHPTSTKVACRKAQ